MHVTNQVGHEDNFEIHLMQLLMYDLASPFPDRSVVDSRRRKAGIATEHDTSVFSLPITSTLSLVILTTPKLTEMKMNRYRSLIVMSRNDLPASVLRQPIPSALD